MSLMKFFSYSLNMAPKIFGITLLREFIWLLLVGPAIVAYVYILNQYQYLDLIVGFYVLVMTFLTHFIFAPSLVLAGGFELGLFNSLKHGFRLLRKKHIYFLMLYILFAIVWLFNSIPILQIISLFFAYPMISSAIIIMAEDSLKMQVKSIKTDNDEEEEDEE